MMVTAIGLNKCSEKWFLKKLFSPTYPTKIVATVRRVLYAVRNYAVAALNSLVTITT